LRLALALVLLLVSLPAHAEDTELPPPLEEPTTHFWIATGGALTLGGPSPGVWAGLGVSGRTWGVRLDGFDFGAAKDDPLGLVTASVTYELARTRRHIILTGHFGGGMRFPEQAPVATAGLHTQLGLMRNGPLVLGSDLVLHFDLGQLPIDVYLVASLSIGLTW
jgi:hypothetical protein